ncbi:MAG TPA: glutathione S-transferase family protein [Steroidobacteraceae bacterium]
MKPSLYAHPFSSYCQKVLIALYENDTPFTFRTIGPEDPAAIAEFKVLWPMQKFPVLVDADSVVTESSVIIEYLMIHHAGPVRLIPSDARPALEVRTLDRFFDNYVMTPMNAVVADFIRAPSDRDPFGVAQAKSLLTRAYQWLDGVMATRTWAAGQEFSLADCAAAPALFYADWVHEIGVACANLRGYRQRLLQRPSFARAVDEARRYRPLFPPGAPARD